MIREGGGGQKEGLTLRFMAGVTGWIFLVKGIQEKWR